MKFDKDNVRLKIERLFTLYGPKDYFCIKGSEHPNKKWAKYCMEDYFLEPGRVYKALCTLRIDFHEDGKQRFENTLDIREGDVLCVSDAEFNFFANMKGLWPAGYVKYNIVRIRNLESKEGTISCFQWPDDNKGSGYGWCQSGYGEWKKRKRPSVKTMFKVIK